MPSAGSAFLQMPTTTLKIIRLGVPRAVRPRGVRPNLHWVLALRQDLEGAAVDRPNNPEVPAIEGYYGSCLIARGKDDDRRVGEPNRLIGVALDDRLCLCQVLGAEGGHIPGAARQFAQRGELGRDAEPRRH